MCYSKECEIISHFSSVIWNIAYSIEVLIYAGVTAMFSSISVCLFLC